MRLLCRIIIFLSLLSGLCFANENNGYKIVKQTFDMWKGQDSSISTITMRIVRPNRTENLTLNSWSKGDDLSISKFVSPAKYDGQGILVVGDSMWTYSPKSRRSIKISNSIKSRAWMGSDMSYDDISVSLESLEQYTYTTTIAKRDNVDIYIVEAIPTREAPVVWGKEVYYIRISDNAMLAKEFFDQSGKMIRRFDAIEIDYYQGDKTKPIMKHMKVTNLEREGYFTEFKIEETEFDVDIDDNIFSLANLSR